jgi:hypothetical protein
MSAGVDHEAAYRTDLTRLCERLAERLRCAGAEHPCVAAVALAVRGLAGLTVEEFALMTGVSGWRIDEIERGDSSWSDLPPGLLQRVACVELEIDLARVLGHPP